MGAFLDKRMKQHPERMQQFREQGMAKRYDVDPFAEVFEFTPGVFSLYVKSPNTGGDPWMHLIVGPERALLVDTAYGIGDLRGLVETLTDKPVYVVNTHYHGDHAMGNYQFDKVYIHKLDADALRAQFDPKTRERFTPGEGAYYTKEDLVPTREYEVVEIGEGYTFDLGGGHVIEAMHVPGHTAGGCSFLDKKNRILFSGDCILPVPVYIWSAVPENQDVQYTTIRAYKESLERLVKRVGEFDTLYGGHSLLQVPSTIVAEMIQVCDAIIANPKEYDEDLLHIGREAYVRNIGDASIAFTEGRV